MEDGLADAVLAEREIYVIEQHMMDRRKFLPFVTVGNCLIRCTLYPFNLVKTRLQSQSGKSMYNGTFHALGSIWKHEGLQGLYRGVGINIPQIVPSVLYIMTYEQVRNEMRKYPALNQNLVKAVVGGAAASLISQTISVPLDIITQHIMLVGREKKGKAAGQPEIAHKYRTLEEIRVPEEMRKRHFGTVKHIVTHLYKTHGVRGFYKGYIMSLCFFVPNSASWWTFYELYKGLYEIKKAVKIQRSFYIKLCKENFYNALFSASLMPLLSFGCKL